MRIKALLMLTFLAFLVSCSNLSKNSVQEANLPMKNGTFNEKIWKEDLIFQRISWYHELTMQFDVLLAHVSPQSSFNFWLSKDELDQMVGCFDSRVVLAYSLDTKEIPYSALYDQLEKSGYSRFDLLSFKKHLLGHPDSQVNGFRLYHIFGICKKMDDHKSLIINFPGYSEKSVK